MIRDAVILTVELIALFVSVSLAVALVQRALGPERLRAWMGGHPVVSALKGIAIGFATPFCTYSAIPMLVGMRQAKVPTAGYVAFIVAAPVLDPILFGALWIIVGTRVAIIYAAVAFAAAMTLALVAQRVGIDSQLRPLANVDARRTAVTSASTGGPEPLGERNDPCPGSDAEQPWQGITEEFPAAARASLRLLRSVAVLLILGVSIGVAIETFVPAEQAANMTGDRAKLSIPIAAALGIPLYFHTELFVPIAESLSEAGVGVGTIVALTIAGAGANVPEFVLLSRLARWRLIGVFFTYVFAVAIAGGILAQAFG